MNTHDERILRHLERSHPRVGSVQSHLMFGMNIQILSSSSTSRVVRIFLLTSRTNLSQFPVARNSYSLEPESLTRLDLCRRQEFYPESTAPTISFLSPESRSRAMLTGISRTVSQEAKYASQVSMSPPRFSDSIKISNVRAGSRVS